VFLCVVYVAVCISVLPAFWALCVCNTAYERHDPESLDPNNNNNNVQNVENVQKLLLQQNIATNKATRNFACHEMLLP